MIHTKKETKIITDFDSNDPYQRLRECAAKKLVTYIEHKANGGSTYITLDDIKIRIADHENISYQYDQPDFNIVSRNISLNEVMEIDVKLTYPTWCKQKAFALHVNCTIPKLKKVLPEECYDEIIENEAYPNTYTKVIKVKEAISYLSEMGYNERRPVGQETYSYEDYCGDFY